MLYKELIQEIEDMTYLFNASSQRDLTDISFYLNAGHIFCAIESLETVLSNLFFSEDFLDSVVNKWICDLKQFVSKGIWISSSGDVFTFDEMINNKIIDYCYGRNGFMVNYACNLDGCIYLPDSVYAIKDAAFCHSKVQEVYIGKNTYMMGFDTFANCPLEVIYFNDVLEEVPSCCCKNCKELKKVYLGKNIHTIRDNAFYNNLGLESIVLPENVKRIEFGAFEECRNLKFVREECKKLQRLDGNCFANCTSLVCFEIFESVLRCNETAFSGCKRTSIHLCVKDKRYIPFQGCFDDCLEVKIYER